MREREGTALAWEVLVLCRGSGLCEPSGVPGASMSRCHVQQKQHSFPCGRVQRQQEPCWESSEKPEGCFLLRVRPKYCFPHGCCCPREGVQWVGGSWCCGLSIPLKVQFSHVCGVSKRWLRGAARAEVFPEVLSLGRVQSTL